MLTSTFSPDGVETVLVNSNPGSLSTKKFLMCLESIIGMDSTNFAIFCGFGSPLRDTICLLSFHVTFGAGLPVG